jgi:hypothetical protein
LQLGQSSLEAATEAMNTISMPGLSASEPPEASPGMLALPPPPIATTPPAPQTPYLQVVGMVTAEVLTDDEEYAEVPPPPPTPPLSFEILNVNLR